MEPSVKNLREWVGLLFLLFCVLDIAGVQYGMQLAGSAPLQPDPDIGAVVAMVQGPRYNWYNVYVTARQMTIFRLFLGGAAVSLFAALGVIVIHGIRRLRAGRKP